ncbi:DUF2756 family protein [Yokenella regensburgei]|uniref:DUF2756 family protein n=1 Tax=Yokenella regensburgei TaxID=158877 RepID=UPI003F18099C
MKPLILVAAFLPFTAFAQPLNTLNNPNQPGYQIPSQQRMQTQMLNQQQQQKGMLNQNLQTQTRLQQQHLESQINNNSQRVRQSQPGELNAGQQQILPNTHGGMLNQSVNSDAPLTQQQHMLPSQQTNGMLNQHSVSTPQANIPLKTVTP